MSTIPKERTAPTPYAPNRVYAYTSDHGLVGAAQTAVANLMKGWEPELYFFGGDNSYPSGTIAEVDAAWAPWSSEIADELVYAALGNHDLETDTGEPHKNFFTYFPGNRRYYSVRNGNIEFFILNSGFKSDSTMVEQDGNTSTGNQAQWLTEAIRQSDAHWKIAIFHHPPYTSGTSYTPGKTELRWDWRNLGIDLVLTGHSHNYERLVVDGMTYVVAGIGGAALTGFASTPLTGSKVRNSSYNGAVKITDRVDVLDVEAWSTTSVLLDSFTLYKRPTATAPDTVS
jgi:hypothetical protein